MPYDSKPSEEDIRSNRRVRAKVAGYESLTKAQRVGYIATIIGIVVFTLATAIVYGPIMM